MDLYVSAQSHEALPDIFILIYTWIFNFRKAKPIIG